MSGSFEVLEAIHAPTEPAHGRSTIRTPN